jgi:hypothetical protein
MPKPIEYTIDRASVPSLHIFRSQELDRFNKLIKIMRKSLSDIKDAING